MVHHDPTKPRLRTARKAVPSGGTVTAPAGVPVVRAVPRSSMPAKLPEAHRWAVFTVHTLTAEGARRAMADGEQVLLDLETLHDLSVGCVDCEQQLTPNNADELLATTCTAPESEWWQG